MGMVVDAKLGLEGLKKKGHDAFRIEGPIQTFIDATVLKGVESYVPFKQGTATKSGILNTRLGHGMLTWRTPYIRPIFHGYRRKKDGTYTNPFVYDQSRHFKAGPNWPEAYKRDNLKRLTAMVRGRVRQEFG